MTFEQVMNQYWQLRWRYEAGLLTADTLERAVQEMQVQDHYRSPGIVLHRHGDFIAENFEDPVQ